ncbi:MAG: hypothetical protein IJ558_09505 [Treponema sp.]|nr:hypothetical protein [Treponema sp.]
MTEKELEDEFYAAVMRDVKILVKNGYRPTAFLNMISQKGVRETAKQLVNSKEPSPGYTKLWEMGCLQYSVENQIQDERWHSLFTDEERTKAKKRLADYNFIVR